MSSGTTTAGQASGTCDADPDSSLASGLVVAAAAAVLVILGLFPDLEFGSLIKALGK